MSRPVEAASYRALLRLPGVAPAFVAAALVRLSYAMVGLAFLLVVKDATGSFAVAGAVFGAFALPTVIMPYKSRIVDRSGVRLPLRGLGLGYATVLAAVVVCAVAGVRAASAYLLLAIAAGVLTPPVGPVMRGIWAGLTPSGAARNRAYSLDGVAEEGLFAIGPLLVGAVLLVADPVAALLLTAILALIGSVALSSSRLVGRLPAATGMTPPQATGVFGPLRLAGVRWLMLAMFGVGVALAPLEVAVVARATEAGSAAAAGYLLAALSLGSAAGGLLWGRLTLTGRRSSLLLVLMGLLGAGTVAAGLTPSLPALAGVLVLTGAVVAPAFVLAYLLADQLGDESVRTETSTWIVTASNVGAAVGLTGAGLLVEHLSARAAFLAGGCCLLMLLPLLLVVRSCSGCGRVASRSSPQHRPPTHRGHLAAHERDAAPRPPHAH